LGDASRTLHQNAMLAVETPFAAEFMESFPFVIRRTDLARLRDYIMIKTGIRSRGEGFAKSFRVLQNRTLQLGGAEHNWAESRADPVADQFNCLPCFQALAGNFLFQFRKVHYAWSIFDWRREQGQESRLELFGIEPEDTCPWMQLAVHVPYHATYDLFERLDHRLTVTEHTRAATSIVRIGLCAAGYVRGWGGDGCKDINAPDYPVLAKRFAKRRQSPLVGLALTLGCRHSSCWSFHYTDRCPRARTWSAVSRDLLVLLGGPDYSKTLRSLWRVLQAAA